MAVFGLAGAAAAYVGVRVHADDPSASWLFAVFAAFFLVIAVCAAMPPGRKEPAPVKFAPVAFVSTALLLPAVLLLLAVAAALVGWLRR